VFSCRILSFSFKRYERYEVDPPEKFGLLRPTFQGHSRLSEPTRIGPPPMTSYRCSMATMGPSHTASEIKMAISVRKKSQFSNPRVFNAPAERILFAIGGRQLVSKKTRMMGLPGREISLTMSYIAIWIQYTNVTDGRMDTGRQQRQRLRIASSSKNA